MSATLILPMPSLRARAAPWFREFLQLGQALTTVSAPTSMAALMMAKARLQAGQVDLAARELTYAMEHGQPEPMKTIARERLARLRMG